MKTHWNTTVEGRQYWVRFLPEKRKFEFSSDPVSELAGGGYAYFLPDILDAHPDEVRNLVKLFGMQTGIEILSLFFWIQGLPPGKLLTSHSIPEAMTDMELQLAIQQSEQFMLENSII